MNKLLVFRLLGKILLIEAAAIMVAFGVSLIYGGADALPLLYSVLIAGAMGFGLVKIKAQDETLRPKEGFATVALSWVALSVFGAMPFFLGGYMGFVDALFETASGFSTTGATISTNVEAMPKGILFWRSLTHWMGGMGVLVLSLAILPKMGARSLNLLKAESPGPTPGKLVPRIAGTARILYRIYLLMTLLNVVALLMCGMGLYDALIHSFGSAGTGGFSNYNASVGHFQSAKIEMVIAVFTTLFSINFSLYYYLMHKNFRVVAKNDELRLFLAILAASVGLIAWNIYPVYGSVAESLRHSFFHVSSVVSTTGYAAVDYNVWPQMSRTIFVMLMLMGACAGSTGGGLKVIRVDLLGKAVWREVRRAVNPRSVQVVKSDGKAIEEGILNQVLVFAAGYLGMILMATLVVALDNFDFETNFTAVISAVSNIGPGLGMVGPVGNFAHFSDRSKLVLTFCMLAGRLEIYPMLMLLMPATWRR